MMRVNDVLETHCTWNIKPDGDNIHREENRNKGDRPMRRPSTYLYIYIYTISEDGNWSRKGDGVTEQKKLPPFVSIDPGV